jgi:hypothetical protein
VQTVTISEVSYIINAGPSFGQCYFTALIQRDPHKATLLLDIDLNGVSKLEFQRGETTLLLNFNATAISFDSRQIQENVTIVFQDNATLLEAVALFPQHVIDIPDSQLAQVSARRSAVIDSQMEVETHEHTENERAVWQAVQVESSRRLLVPSDEEPTAQVTDHKTKATRRKSGRLTKRTSPHNPRRKKKQVKERTSTGAAESQTTFVESRSSRNTEFRNAEERSIEDESPPPIGKSRSITSKVACTRKRQSHNSDTEYQPTEKRTRRATIAATKPPTVAKKIYRSQRRQSVLRRSVQPKHGPSDDDLDSIESDEVIAVKIPRRRGKTVAPLPTVGMAPKTSRPVPKSPQAVSKVPNERQGQISPELDEIRNQKVTWEIVDSQLEWRENRDESPDEKLYSDGSMELDYEPPGFLSRGSSQECVEHHVEQFHSKQVLSDPQLKKPLSERNVSVARTEPLVSRKSLPAISSPGNRTPQVLAQQSDATVKQHRARFDVPVSEAVRQAPTSKKEFRLRRLEIDKEEEEIVSSSPNFTPPPTISKKIGRMNPIEPKVNLVVRDGKIQGGAAIAGRNEGNKIQERAEIRMRMETNGDTDRVGCKIFDDFPDISRCRTRIESRILDPTREVRVVPMKPNLQRKGSKIDAQTTSKIKSIDLLDKFEAKLAEQGIRISTVDRTRKHLEREPFDNDSISSISSVDNDDSPVQRDHWPPPLPPYQQSVKDALTDITEVSPANPN